MVPVFLLTLILGKMVVSFSFSSLFFLVESTGLGCCLIILKCDFLYEYLLIRLMFFFLLKDWFVMLGIDSVKEK